MTESEAIETLIGIRLVSGYSKSREEALDMAIAALEKQEGEGWLTMAEYIEREAAIKIVNTPNYNKHDMLFALKTIPAASAADMVEVRHGNWIHREDFDYVDNKNAKHWHGMCDQCGFIHDFLDCHTGQYNYCPNCGAKMYGGVNDGAQV